MVPAKIRQVDFSAPSTSGSGGPLARLFAALAPRPRT